MMVDEENTVQTPGPSHQARREGDRWCGITLSDSNTPFQPHEWEFLIEKPHDAINEIFEITSSCSVATTQGDSSSDKSWINNIVNYIHNGVVSQDVELRQKIPSLNALDDNQIKVLNGRVVRFRGMIQEMFDPIMFKARLPVRQTNLDGTTEVIQKCALYCDVLKVDADSELMDDDGPDGLDLFELDQFHCISVPGENLWVTDRDKKYSDCVAVDEAAVEERLNKMALVERGLVKPPSASQKTATLCYPLPSMYEDKRSKACIVKVYKSPHGICMNDVLEFYGILSVDEDSGDDHNVEEEFELLEDEQAEDLVRNPDPSLVQRLFVLGYTKICGNEAKSEEHMLTRQECTILDKPISREYHETLQILLTEILTDVFMGDKLCAQYMLCSLLSQVYVRVADKPLGPFPLNFTGVPSGVGSFLNEVLESILPRNVYVPNMYNSFRSQRYAPRKDYRCNKLETGALQLACGTHLLIDIPSCDPAAQPVQPRVEENLLALTRLVEKQEVVYEFKFNEMTFLHDVPVVLLSANEKRESCNMNMSVLEIPLRPYVEPERYENEVKSRIRQIFTDVDVVNNIRSYILISRKSCAETSLKMMESVEKKITEFYNRRRQLCTPTSYDLSTLCQAPQLAGPDYLHRLLTMARLLMASRSEAELTMETWTTIEDMEEARNARLKVAYKIVIERRRHWISPNCYC